MAPSLRRLRIALVSEYYYPDVGGIPEHMHHLGQGLARRGHQVAILTTAYAQPPPQVPGLEVLRLGRACAPLIANGSVSRAAVGLRLGRQMAALFAERGFDIIHVHGPTFPVLPLLAIRHAPPEATLVGTLHCHFEDSLLLRLLRRPLQRYLDALDALITVSDTAVASLQRVGLRCDASLIPNGVDLSYWRSGRPLPALRADGRLNLLVQARLEPRNDLPLVLAALARLGAAAPRLLVVGEGPAGAALRGSLEALPVSRRPQVHWAGARISDRNDYAASSDLYAFTARIASHPMALLEGMAAGLPTLAHDIPGARELLRDGVDGLLLPVGDVDAYAAALQRLCQEPLLRRRLGQAARERALPFCWGDITARTEALYQEVLARRQPGAGRELRAEVDEVAEVERWLPKSAAV